MTTKAKYLLDLEHAVSLGPYEQNGQGQPRYTTASRNIQADKHLSVLVLIFRVEARDIDRWFLMKQLNQESFLAMQEEYLRMKRDEKQNAQKMREYDIICSSSPPVGHF